MITVDNFGSNKMSPFTRKGMNAQLINQWSSTIRIEEKKLPEDAHVVVLSSSQNKWNYGIKFY